MIEWRFRRFTKCKQGLAVIATLAAVAATGCSLVGPTRDELRDGAFSLLPSGSRVVKVVEGDCVELAPSPSCVHIYFVRLGTLEARTAAVENAALTKDWTQTLQDELPGGTQLNFRRDRLRAFVFLEPVLCRKNPRPRCVDVVMVENAA